MWASLLGLGYLTLNPASARITADMGPGYAASTQEMTPITGFQVAEANYGQQTRHFCLMDVGPRLKVKPKASLQGQISAVPRCLVLGDTVSRATYCVQSPRIGYPGIL